MSYLKKTLALSLVAIAITGCTQQEQEAYPVSEKAPTEEQAKMAYALGASVGTFVNSNLVEQDKMDLELDRNQVIAGFVDSLKDTSKITEEEQQELLTAMQQQFTEKKAANLGAEAKATGDAYLAENAEKAGVMVTESGLQYEVLNEGEEGGKQPTAEDIVQVHYEGTLIDGTVFDSSVERGEPATFPLNRVIPGWTEGVQLMSVGDKFRFVIPPELAYGDREVGGGTIPPKSTLIFEVELLDVKEKPAMEAPAADVEAEG
ncbi:FKBP-type peptidyl-prolyl cis-trans isomerase FkpA [Pseudidiomarina piscicola]|uniref:Peptidyl-prolyl cis-trans isomerase n=1 Tax=Pseudidiomarina piscicola TaxID=2614830 RepID=A0A6S6WQN3_9GAMM|nr:FKBP-type peptidyl-prolyl cis-trans isomerase [Pseudidiomarina piscicola]CAB0151757.1 FKBP-type peptidyl-prolyl cis-trans isomerase FkpA [Pseudidiomarina piscicola]VZT41212.1 FKBP-type peptidyl-prolyl cis-trans isomerase FkpA [Pseudomonas aeruginosa]